MRFKSSSFHPIYTWYQNVIGIRMRNHLILPVCLHVEFLMHSRHPLWDQISNMAGLGRWICLLFLFEEGLIFDVSGANWKEDVVVSGHSRMMTFSYFVRGSTSGDKPTFKVHATSYCLLFFLSNSLPSFHAQLLQVLNDQKKRCCLRSSLFELWLVSLSDCSVQRPLTT